MFGIFVPGAARGFEGEDPAAFNFYWYERAQEIARRRGLSDVFERQLMQESGFANDVIMGQRVSWAGAQGIAQIMRSYHPYVEPLDPEAALDYASRHMLDLLLRFEGSKSKALASYNAGAGTVEWAIGPGGDQWLALMPLETQEYVAIIMRPDEPDRMAQWPKLRQTWLHGAEWIERPVQLEPTESRKLVDARKAAAEAAAVAAAIPPSS